ncbi:HPF/RaiA family ribosome-associated protein [Actinomadura sp. NTSP31]|uniref:HPF/RaiA family ribosome-associated protein n=1 Tax=Actinomadura sp. NTSP31 TaxID=1735447 RepID=UPI0035BFF61C
MPDQDRSRAGSPAEAAPTLPMCFALSGDVNADQMQRARTVFSRVLAHAHEPVLSVRATLALAPLHSKSSTAEASVQADINGRLLHAHAEAASLHEAIAATADRLAAQMTRSARDWESRRGQHPRRSRGDGDAPALWLP